MRGLRASAGGAGALLSFGSCICILSRARLVCASGASRSCFQLSLIKNAFFKLCSSGYPGGLISIMALEVHLEVLFLQCLKSASSQLHKY